MKTKALLLLAMGIPLIGAGCAQYLDCPAFPEELVSYFPYVEGDTLIFVNQDSDTLLYSCSAVEKTEEYTKKQPFGSKCGPLLCNPSYLSFEFIPSDSLNPQLHGQMNVDDDKFTAISVVPDLYISFDDYAEIGDAILLQENEINDNRINSITIVKGQGITEFSDQQRHCTWILKKSIKKPYYKVTQKSKTKVGC
jgi:hypothetical protein